MYAHLKDDHTAVGAPLGENCALAANQQGCGAEGIWLV